MLQKPSGVFLGVGGVFLGVGGVFPGIGGVFLGMRREDPEAFMDVGLGAYCNALKGGCENISGEESGPCHAGDVTLPTAPMLFLTPKYIKQGRLYIKEAEKRLAYNRDKWSEVTIADFEGQIEKLKKAVKGRDSVGVKGAEDALEQLCGVHCPLKGDAWMSENVEVFVVAIIVALGIRTYFIQPFTIPTSSMFPTLNGITGEVTKEEPPNILKKVWHTAAYGRTWHNVVAKADEQIISVEETPWMRIFTYTKITTSAGNTYWVHEGIKPTEEVFGRQTGGPDGFSMIGMKFKAGEPIARGFTDTGDHVFVDKMSYHFRTPSRGEVFVFHTQDIPKMGNLGPPPKKPSQFYIKRLVGVPGDELRIAAPELFVNGERAKGLGFERVMGGTREKPADGGYRGYAQGPTFYSDEYNLSTVGQTYKLPAKRYFAMGDNSYNSSDSRYWGSVPEQNLMGTALFVYWPFLREHKTHFGLIK